jgi:hypothetical protein
MNRRLIRLAESPDIRFWRVDYGQLSAPERVFGVIWELESEVNNGGFYQYFWNSSGALAPHSIEALKEIGADATAALAREALTLAGDGIEWSDDAARQARIDRLPRETKNKLDELDQAFYASPDDLTSLLYKYVSGHKREIGTPADF